MAPKPQFSIIIPALNEEKYLPRLLGDLSRQTFSAFEVIVVDGHSDDQTTAKTKSFQKKLPLLKIIACPKRHVCAQRNLGTKHAQANTFIFMDADVRLNPSFLLGVKYRLETNSVDLLSPYFEPDVKSRQNETITTTLNIFNDLQMSIKPKFLFESMIIISKKAFLAVKGFDENLDYAEGKSFIQNLLRLGFSAKVIKDPSYTFSFRRLRKFGIIHLASRLAKLELAELLGPEFKSLHVKNLYPMLGGTIFNQNKKIKNKFQKNIAKLLADVKMIS